MNPLLERFHKEQKALNRLKNLCESKVVSWEYWNWPIWYWDPEDFLEVRKYAKKVSKDKAQFGLGRDKDGKVVLIRQFDVIAPRKLLYMDFLRYSGHKIIGSQFLEGDLCEVFECILVNGRIVRLECLYGTVEWEWKSVEWRDDRVAAVTYGAYRRKPHAKVLYDKAGRKLDTIDLTKPVKRKPLPRGVTMSGLAKEIRRRLVNAVIQTVIKARVKEPAYCLVLNYDCEGNPLLLPELGIGLDSERRALLKRGGRNAKLDIWDPENFSIFANNRTTLKDRKLDKACDLFNRELEYKGSDEPARKLILQAAADLARTDWKGKLNATQDFVVYAVDTDIADLRRNLKLTVPRKKLNQLKAVKFL